MAQHTLLAPPINSAVQRWIAANADAIKSTAAALGISPTSIALAVSEEASHIVSTTAMGLPNENPKDLIQDILALFFPSHI